MCCFIKSWRNQFKIKRRSHIGCRIKLRQKNLFFSFLEEEGVSDVDAAFDVTFPARKAFLVNRFNIENSTYKRAVMVLTRSCLPVSPNSFSLYLSLFLSLLHKSTLTHTHTLLIQNPQHQKH